MFGVDIKPSVHLDPEKLAKLDEQQIYLLFSENNWEKIDKVSRLAVLQEVENRRARLDRRPPIPVLEGSREEFENPASLGYYNDNDRIIRINYRYLEGKSPYHTPYGALDVVVHEGRHAMQSDVIREHPDRVAMQILNEWRSSKACYFSPNDMEDPDDSDNMMGMIKMAIYAMQSIEIDARRTARNALLEVSKAFEVNGLDDRGVAAQLISNLQEEYNIILLVQHTLTLEKLDELEKLVLAAMHDRFPEVDTSKLRVFDHARLILKAPDIETLENPIDLIAFLDQFEQGKMDLIKDKLSLEMKEETLDRVASIRLNKM